MAERIVSRKSNKGRTGRRNVDMTIVPPTSLPVDPDSLTRELRDLDRLSRGQIRIPSRRKSPLPEEIKQSAQQDY